MGVVLGNMGQYPPLAQHICLLTSTTDEQNALLRCSHPPAVPCTQNSDGSYVTGLVGYWPLSPAAASGGTQLDKSGFGHDLTTPAISLATAPKMESR